MPLSTVSATQNCKKRTGQIYSFMVDYKVNGGHRYDDERFKENFIKINYGMEFPLDKIKKRWPETRILALMRQLV